MIAFHSGDSPTRWLTGHILAPVQYFAYMTPHPYFILSCHHLSSQLQDHCLIYLLNVTNVWSALVIIWFAHLLTHLSCFNLPHRNLRINMFSSFIVFLFNRPIDMFSSFIVFLFYLFESSCQSLILKNDANILQWEPHDFHLHPCKLSGCLYPSISHVDPLICLYRLSVFPTC
jgi:hypothetical protein